MSNRFRRNHTSQTSHIVWVVVLDGGKLQPYIPRITILMEQAWQRQEQELDVSFKTVGGHFKYTLRYYSTIDRTIEEREIAAGVQINTVSGIDRPLKRYNLFLWGSPTGALWLYASSDLNTVQKPHANPNDDVNENGGDPYNAIFNPAVCVALERRLFEGRMQALILERGEHPYLIIFSDQGHHTKLNIVTQETVSVKRMVKEPMLIPELPPPEPPPSNHGAAVRMDTDDDSPQVGVAHPQAAKQFANPQSSKQPAVQENKKEIELSWKRRANKLYMMLTQVRWKDVSKEEKKDLIVPTKTELHVFLKKYVDDIDSKVVKDNETPVVDSIWQGMTEGIGGLSGPGAAALARISKKQLRHIFGSLTSPSTPISDIICKRYMGILVDSWMSCTAEQVRATDRLFGIISGREMSFPQQVLMSLDRYKDLVLEKLTIWMASTVAKGNRFPHLLNRLRLELGGELGLSGEASAAQDPYIVPRLSVQSKQLAQAKFYEFFDTMEFIRSVMIDVNIQADSAERVVHAKTLLEFAQVEHEKRKLEQHRILYQDDEAHLYDAKPDNAYDVFLHPGTALDVVEIAVLRLLENKGA
eukprot:m.42451 g.42451  ORF g.42451 m.42451 type:complete len:585 (+) comp9884_c0_seq1:574-2328(+)